MGRSISMRLPLTRGWGKRTSPIDGIVENLPDIDQPGVDIGAGLLQTPLGESAA